MKASRIAWALVIAPPLLALAVVAALTALQHPREPHTGDAMLDEFIAEVLRVNPALAEAEGAYYSGIPTLDLPDSRFGAWEAEYGQEPEFWLLRFAFVKPPPEAAQDSQTRRERRSATLEQAAAHGCSDAALLARRLNLRLSEWRREAMLLTQVPYPKPGQDKGAYDRDIQRLLDLKHRSELDDLQQELIAMAPKEAMPHYLRASTLALRGDYSAGLDEVARGNALPLETVFRGSPFEQIHDPPEGSFWPREKALWGAFLQNATSPPFGLRRLTTALQLLAEDAARRDDRRALTALHRCACRLYDTYLHHGLPSSGDLIDSIYQAQQTHGKPTLSTAQLAALNELAKGISEFKATVFSQTNARSSTQAVSVQNGLWQRTLQAYTSDWLAFTARLAVATAEDHAQQQRAYRASLKPLLERLERFDYETFSWEAGTPP